MSSLLCLALSNAMLATLLAVLAAVVARVCRRPAVRHGLWLLVLLKLITPPLLPLSLTWPPSGAATVRERFPSPLPDSRGSETSGAATVRERLVAPLPDGRGSETIATATDKEEPASPLPDGRGLDVWLALLVIWLGGAMAWWTVAAVRLRRFRRLLRQAQPATMDVQEQGQRMAALLGLRRCPPIVFVSAPLSPMLWALGFSPRLLVPAELWRKLTAQQQDTLLAHELAHLRRGDHWIRRLELLVLGLYWWHPVVWWSRRRLQEAEEECCDALVIAMLPDAALAYASALVETVTFLSQTRPAALVGASGAGHVPLLKRRLTMILTETSSRKPSRIGFWIVLGLGALLLPLAPREAQTQAPEKPKGEKAKDAPTIYKHDIEIERNVYRLADNPLAHQMHNCASCHVMPLHGQNFDDKPQSWKHSHDEIVRLLDEVRTRRTELQAAEDRLNRALVALKRLETHSDPHANNKWNVTWAEAMFDRRSHDLGTLPPRAIVEHVFVMTNSGQHPVHIASLRTSAGCLSAQVAAPPEALRKSELIPKGRAELIARLDSSKFTGEKTFKIFVEFDKPERQQVVLEIRAKSQTAAPAKPQSPERLQQLEKKLDELRKEMEKLRHEMQPDKPQVPPKWSDKVKR